MAEENLNLKYPQAIPDNEFRVGITMAGAGSAGCYTGGVMDYLFEILDLWEKAKNENLPGYEEFYSFIPKHNVIIDVMGGTSAGGMASVMSVIYALNGKINPVIDPLAVGGIKNNILYDSWVGLDDDVKTGGEKTLAKAWHLDDLKNDKFLSLLNTKIIDDIADRALKQNGQITEKVKNLPSYISKDLDLLQVHTMLRGLPLAINFSTPIGEVKGVAHAPAHNFFEHFIVSHYKLGCGELPDLSRFLWFNPYDEKYRQTMKLTTKSTGAFPVGLRFREIDGKTFTDEYIKNVTERTIYNRFGQKDNSNVIDWANFPMPFNFLTVDGGVINNEPFGEVLGILKHRYNECFKDGYFRYGIIMIDPFPDLADTEEKYDKPDDLFGVVPAIISTMHDQSKVKKADMVEASENPYYRGEIFPRKWKNHKADDAPIASATVSAFGGFLDINFRHYDFFLGRDNARNYLRYYFSFEYDTANKIIHPIHRTWTPQMIEKFIITRKDGKTYLPIIPDLKILQELKKDNKKQDPFNYSIKDKPQFDPNTLFAQRPQMEDRFERILDLCKLKLLEKGKEKKHPETDIWMEQYYHKSTWDKIKGWFIDKCINLAFIGGKGGLARNITEMAVKWVLTDLEKGGFLKKNNTEKK